jgi:hypothetical protein
MELPKTTKGYLKLLLAIADDSGSYELKGATKESGKLIADIRANIQNELGDDCDNVLEKYNLKWD